VRAFLFIYFVLLNVKKTYFFIFSLSAQSFSLEIFIDLKKKVTFAVK